MSRPGSAPPARVAHDHENVTAWRPHGTRVRRFPQLTISYWLAHRPRRFLVHNEQAKLAATFWNNLAVVVLFSVFLVPAFYTQHTMLQQALSIGGGLAAAIGLRMLSHWWLRRLRE